MPRYYIQAELNGVDEYFALDCMQSITRSLTGSATAYPLEGSGENISDNYVNKNVILRGSGIISDVKTEERLQDDRFNKKTVDFISKLEQVKNDKILFTIFFNATEGGANNAPFQRTTDCVFESLNITQDNQSGVTRRGVSSYRISFSAKQLRFGVGATRDKLPFDPLASTVTEKIYSGGLQHLSNKTLYRNVTTGLVVDEFTFNNLGELQQQNYKLVE